MRGRQAGVAKSGIRETKGQARGKARRGEEMLLLKLELELELELEPQLGACRIQLQRARIFVECVRSTP